MQNSLNVMWRRIGDGFVSVLVSLVTLRYLDTFFLSFFLFLLLAFFLNVVNST